MVKKVGMPWITVSNIDQAKKLFVEIMGLKIYEDNKDYNWMEIECNGTFLGIYAIKKINLKDQYKIDKKIDIPGQNAIITFNVYNIDQMIEKMKLNEIFFEPIIIMEGNFKMVTFFDIDNNKFQLYQSLKI